MNKSFTTYIVILLAALSLSSCSNTPMPKDSPDSSADSQRSRSDQAQDELSREIAR